MIATGFSFSTGDPLVWNFAMTTFTVFLDSMQWKGRNPKFRCLLSLGLERLLKQNERM